MRLVNGWDRQLPGLLHINIGRETAAGFTLKNLLPEIQARAILPARTPVKGKLTPANDFPVLSALWNLDSLEFDVPTVNDDCFAIDKRRLCYQFDSIFRRSVLPLLFVYLRDGQSSYRNACQDRLSRGNVRGVHGTLTGFCFTSRAARIDYTITINKLRAVSQCRYHTYTFGLHVQRNIARSWGGLARMTFNNTLFLLHFLK